MRQERTKQPLEDLAPSAAQARIEAAFKKHRFGLPWCVPAIVCVWLLAAAYLVFMPPVYHSKWSLILPVASNASTVSLDKIGQTSTRTSHSFGSRSLSPKVIYKEIAGSEQVRKAAADSMAMKLETFGKARVKLIAETSLMIFRIAGDSPEHARDKAQALMTAFKAQLDSLRQDEREKRASLARANLRLYRSNLENVRRKRLEFQRNSGLLSIAQFKEAALSVELLRRRLGEQRAKRHRLITRQQTLTKRLGLSAELAATGVRLASDPSFVQLSGGYAKDMAAFYAAQRKFGSNHPRLRRHRLRAGGTFDELQKLALANGVHSPADVRKLALLNESNQSDLFKSMIANESDLAGQKREVVALEEELAELEVKVNSMGRDAARLEALEKDHLVAEAVFTSAAARLDMGRTDLFASYPIVQVLAEPDLAIKRSQPRLAYAAIAGLLGTIFILLAWGMPLLVNQSRRLRRSKRALAQSL